MNCLTYLQNNQPIAYKIFRNSLEKKNFFHCYLLSGLLGTPLKEISIFLAKSILCENPSSLFCCNECNSCKRIDAGNYPNLVFLDGSSSQIKKSDITSIIDYFSTNSIEKNQKRVYIIHLAENMNEDATNALLKFLEEPRQDIYAILTTENKFRLLPTIKSRSLIINFSQIQQSELINEAISEGCDSKLAELLSFFYNDSSMIKSMSENEDIIRISTLASSLLEKLNNKKECIYFAEKNVISNIKTRENAYIFYDSLIIFLKESLKYKLDRITVLKSHLNTIKIIIDSVNDLPTAITNLVNDRNELNYNLIINLLVWKSINDLIGE